MPKKNDSNTLILLLKLDSENLYKNITLKKKEYINEYSLKRTRDHFNDIFYTRYPSCDINDLKQLDNNLITALNNFYKTVNELKWYLDHTQDMTNALEDRVNFYIKTIKKYYDELQLFIDGFEDHDNINIIDQDPPPFF